MPRICVFKAYINRINSNRDTNTYVFLNVTIENKENISRINWNIRF